MDSPESDKLKKLIGQKIKSYHKMVENGNKTAAAYIQQEIMFLQNDILPVVLRFSNILHAEVANYAIRVFDVALKNNCNAIVFCIPIKVDYKDNPIVGVVNTKQDLPFGTPEAMEVFVNEIEIINMDGNGVKFVPFNLPLNDLI